MKKVILFIFFCYALTTVAQRDAIDEISKASEAISTLQANFTQTKKVKMLSNAMVSEGKMWCTQPNRLRWEYTSPNPFAIILSDGRVMMKGSKRNHTIRIDRNRMLREITGLIIPSGLGKNLTEGKDFLVSVESKQNEHILSLVPQSKETKQLFSRIVLYYDRQQAVVRKVEMWEKTGDNTLIELTSIKKNAEIDDAIYKQEPI